MPDLLTATVTDDRFLSPHVREIVLEPDAPLEFVPGQWLSLRLPVGDRPPLIRAYSLALPPAADGRLVLSFDRVAGGLGSEYLWQIEPGAAVEFSGPMGSFVMPDGPESLLFIARYTGIVPFRAMLHLLANSGTKRRVGLVYTAPTEEERIYGDELAALAGHSPWLTYLPVVGEDVTEAVREAADALAPFAPMVCGVREFTFPLRQFLMETYGFDRRAVKLENYTGPAR